MKVLLTGACGFIGSHLAETLLKEGKQVVGVDNFDPFYSRQLKNWNLSQLTGDKNFSLREGDLSDKGFTKELLMEKPDVIIHLAAKAGVRPSIEDPQGYLQSNIQATLNLVQGMQEHGLKKMVFASSSSVYGKNSTIPFTEDQELSNFISPYAYTKKSGEDLLTLYHNLYDLSFISLRLFTVYGPRQRPDLAIHKFFHLLHQEKTLTVFGDGSMKRDYTYVDDIVSGIKGAMQRILGEEKSLNEVYNLGNETPVSLSDLLSTIEEVSGKKLKKEHVEVPPGDVPVTYADISRARKNLGYDPQTKLKEGLKYFLQWYKEYYSQESENAA